MSAAIEARVPELATGNLVGASVNAIIARFVVAVADQSPETALAIPSMRDSGASPPPDGESGDKAVFFRSVIFVVQVDEYNGDESDVKSLKPITFALHDLTFDGKLLMKASILFFKLVGGLKIS
jgi:hypothetical protein